MDNQPDDKLECSNDEHQAILKILEKGVYSGRISEAEAAECLIDYWLAYTGEMNMSETSNLPEELELFDPIYAFAEWTDEALISKLDEYECTLKEDIRPGWRAEIERQTEHIRYELAFRQAEQD